MFKAGLIENQAYYKWRRMILLIGIPLSLIIGIISNLWTLGDLWKGIVLLLFIVLFWIQWRIQHSLLKHQKNRRIEIDNEQITIKNKLGETDQTIRIDDVEKIIVKKNYEMPEETLSAIFRSMLGHVERNFIRIKREDQDITLEFTLDSYYMIEQLKKIIHHWESMELKVEEVA